MDGRMDRRMGGRMVGFMDGWMYGWIDGSSVETVAEWVEHPACGTDSILHSGGHCIKTLRASRSDAQCQWCSVVWYSVLFGTLKGGQPSSDASA